MKQFIKKKLKFITQKNPYILKFLYLALKGSSSSFVIYREASYLFNMFLYIILRKRYYRFLAFIKNSQSIKEKPISNLHDTKHILPKSVYINMILDCKNVSLKKFEKFLAKENLNPEQQFYWCQQMIGWGRLDLAKAGFIQLLNRKSNKLPEEIQLECFRYAGICCFLLGQNKEANYYLKMTGIYRRSLFRVNTPKNYRILGNSWFAALGHVCMLDYYLKYVKMYLQGNVRIVAPYEPAKISGQVEQNILQKLSMLGITILKPDGLEADYNFWAKDKGFPQWDALSKGERAALIDDFWQYDFNDGNIFGFAHALARIQKEWEQKELRPLFSLSDLEKNWIREYLVTLGMPKDAWYVCLHIREPGYHKNWNSMYPSMRDANVLDYQLAIEAIVKAGGWVIRMGDPSMKPLPIMHHVIDYAHSSVRTSTADLLLPAGCTFLLGTNSGYIIISSMYNVPCALTNWVPIGWPLWSHQDLMIPKLFREKFSGKYLTLEQIFKSELAYPQNYNELPSNIELVPNTPEEIRDLTLEMLSQCNIDTGSTKMQSGAPPEIEACYENIAKKYGSYTGSRLGRTFVEKYKSIFYEEHSAPEKYEVEDQVKTSETI